MLYEVITHYIDTSATATPAYERLGADLEEYTVEMSANVNTTKNILGATSTAIDSYEITASVEPYYAVTGDAMFTKLQAIIDDRKTLDDLNTSVIEVHLWEETAEDSGIFAAYKENAVIEVVSYGGDTTGYQIPFNIHYAGTRVKGTFTLATKTFTAT